MLLSPSSKIRSYTGPRTLWAPLLLVGRGWGWGVVSCGSRLVHTPIALNILAGTIILASFHPCLQLEKRSGEFRREQKVLSRISGLSGRDHTLEAVVRKLGVNRQQSLARVRRTWGIREKSPGIP